MFKMRCHVCGSTHTKKNGVRKGVQLNKCQVCGYQFRAGNEVSEDDLWDAYQQEKQTIKELSERYGKSIATIKRRLHDIKREWVQPPLSGEGFVHLDVTYWGRSFGVLMALDDQTGKPLYIAFVKSETVKDYEDAVSSIKGRGYTIRGLIIDGKQSLFKTFSEYPIQMCQFRTSSMSVWLPINTSSISRVIVSVLSSWASRRRGAWGKPQSVPAPKNAAKRSG